MYNNYYNKTREMQTTNNEQKIQDEILVRKDIIGELDAINQYAEHILSAESQKVKQVLTSIKREEEVHVGELVALLFSLDKESQTQFEKGVSEFESITVVKR